MCPNVHQGGQRKLLSYNGEYQNAEIDGDYIAYF